VTDEFFSSYIETGIELGNQCQDVVGGAKDAGPHMSTRNARDLVGIVEAFVKTADGKRAEKPSDLLNYFGYSYGTFLGQAFASMFPTESVKWVWMVFWVSNYRWERTSPR